MNRIIAFSRRNFKEILRDPLSYIFCLGFPLIMLVIMTLVNESIPAEAGMVIFRIDYLSGGIAVFGLTFIMLFTSLSVAKDRAGAFLVRLYATPMHSGDFIMGYIAPVMVIALAQVLSCHRKVSHKTVKIQHSGKARGMHGVIKRKRFADSFF